MPVSFEQIRLGENYSRKELADCWGYASYHPLARGVVTPRNDDKIILFVTGEKQNEATPYEDRLDGDLLKWEGPNDHFAEQRMVDAERDSEEIHLFYRRRHHDDFAYLGQLRVLEVARHSTRPSRFTFTLMSGRWTDGLEGGHDGTTERATSRPVGVSRSYGWAGLLADLVPADASVVIREIHGFLPGAGREELDSWRSSLKSLQQQGAIILRHDPQAGSNGAVFEYELPREGGRRPDVVILAPGVVIVLEFKAATLASEAAIDQVAAYARDLAQYHEASQDREVTPVLVLGGAEGARWQRGPVHVIGPARLAELALDLAGGRTGLPVDLAAWLSAQYAPLPGLVEAARMLFENRPLPFIRRAESAGIPQTVGLVQSISQDAARTSRRCLVLLTGVPGAGKTLVGLQLVHSSTLQNLVADGQSQRRGAPATFLSGNGPLIEVLQDALGSKVFVQDMHRYIRHYGLRKAHEVPPEHVIVFDEAQRAWDREKLIDFYSKRNLPDEAIARANSEPRLLVRIAERIPDWTVVLGLVGEGQEIHTGEEGGIAQWADAVASSSEDWLVFGPPELSRLFAETGIEFAQHAELSLDTTLRSHRASDVHEWVGQFLDDGDADAAHGTALRLRNSTYPIYVARDVEQARAYARQRFAGESIRRFGLMASSKAKCLLPYGIDCGFQATRRLRVGRWYNAEPTDPLSCCQLRDVITEFQAQGLELDLPIVCWGEDFFWEDGAWSLKSTRRQRLVRDPMRLRTNAYRVLLTRGREGVVVFVPPERRLDPTWEILQRAGAMDLGALALTRSA